MFLSLQGRNATILFIILDFISNLAYFTQQHYSYIIRGHSWDFSHFSFYWEVSKVCHFFFFSLHFDHLLRLVSLHQYLINTHFFLCFSVSCAPPCYLQFSVQPLKPEFLPSSSWSRVFWERLSRSCLTVRFLDPCEQIRGTNDNTGFFKKWLKSKQQNMRCLSFSPLVWVKLQSRWNSMVTQNSLKEKS